MVGCKLQFDPVLISCVFLESHNSGVVDEYIDLGGKFLDFGSRGPDGREGREVDGDIVHDGGGRDGSDAVNYRLDLCEGATEKDETCWFGGS